MSTKSQLNETVVANALLAIFERLDGIERTVNVLAGLHLAANPPPTAGSKTIIDPLVLAERLSRLTLKRHAVLTATLGGLSYHQIATLMGCDVTTVKLHLKSALERVGVRGRSVLLSNSKSLLDCISDADYLQHYGISKSWWLESNPALLSVLRTVKPGKNQHTSTQRQP